MLLCRPDQETSQRQNIGAQKSESESEWALLARYVYTYKEFVIVTKLHSATEWQQQDRTQTTKEQYTNIQIGNVQNSKNTMQYRQSCVYRSDMCKFEMEVRTTLRSLLRSDLVAELNQTVIDVQRTDSMMAE